MTSDITRTLAAVALAAAALAAATAVSAQTDLPRSAGTVGAELPARGMTMDTVQSRFGAPAQTLAAVGDPPITRWDYGGYIVYFEHRHVVHSVVKQPLP
jgi:hypothetical protein